jgi:hypothetical protein
MIVEVRDGRCQLVDAGNFRALKITALVDTKGLALDAALHEIGSLVSEDDVLVRPDALKRLAGPGVSPGWILNFENMLRQAGTHGWIDEATGWIKVHVEYV